MKRLFLILLLSTTYFANAQIERDVPPPTSSEQIRLAENRLVGKVVEKSTGRGLEAVSVQLYLLKPGGVDSLIRGSFSRTNGDFSFGNLPAADSFRLIISGIGYGELSRTVRLNAAGTDLGNLMLVQESQVMSNVVISTQQRPALQMGIDRKVFSADRNITATGGTALDVMRNIPSVSVDAEGNVQLRRASPQIFVDGRPTILTPDQIPADQVERVELITNPSSKFDAASSGGIINIVMKQSRRVGINGVATVGAGHPSILNGNLSLNVRQGKLNFFATGGYNQTGGRARSQTERQNKSGGIIQDYFNQRSINNNLRRFGSVRFGVDFFASNRTTLSLTQSIVDGSSTSDQEQNQEFLNSGKVLERTGYRASESDNNFGRYGTQLNFIRRFAKAGRELTGSLTYNRGRGDDATTIRNAFFFPNGLPTGPEAQLRNLGDNSSRQYTFQTDYVNPLTDSSKLELGIRSYRNQQRSLFSSFSVQNGAETLLPVSNNYSFTEMVQAAYASYSNKIKRFGYQVGLRAELSRFEGALLDSGKTFGYNYPRSASRFFDALFPSIFLTQDVGEKAQLQLNYSRRIRRPDFWQLNPFVDINDPLNLRQGNPLLQPEFVNSFEFNYSQDYAKGNFLGVVYYRNNLGDITRFGDTISTALYNQLNNATVDPKAILNTFINARSTNRLGLELTLQHRFSAVVDIVPTIDMQYRDVNAEAIGLSNTGFNWDAELTTNVRFAATRGLLHNLGLQLIGEYESAEVTVQGRNLPQYQVDFGLRKEFLKDKKAAFSFNINDIFNTLRFGSVFDTENFYQESYRRRNVRSFRLAFTYKFGKNDFKLFGREERRRNEDD